MKIKRNMESVYNNKNPYTSLKHTLVYFVNFNVQL